MYPDATKTILSYRTTAYLWVALLYCIGLALPNSVEENPSELTLRLHMQQHCQIEESEN